MASVSVLGAPEVVFEADILVAGDENLVAHVRHLARYGENSEVVDEDGLVLVAGSHPHPGPYRNFAFSFGVMDPVGAAARARSFFAERRRGFVFWVARHNPGGLDEELAPIGALLEQDGLPQMYLLESPEPVEPPEGVTLEVVTERSQMREFLDVNVAGWGMAGMLYDTARATFFEPMMIEHPDVRAILARRGDGVPVAAALAYVHRGVCGGYWGATIPEARRQGIADVVVRRMWSAGFEIGAEVAVNQASGSGIEIWKRMGCAEVTRYNRWLVTQP